MTCCSAVCRRILTLLAVLVLAGNAGARWTRIAGFGEVVNCGFFFNEQRGLIGLDYPAGIMRTYDGGMTWQSSTVPVGYYGTVNDIFMKDSLSGWAITEKLQNDNIFGEHKLWRTVDGGLTWTEVPAVVEMGTSVYETDGGLLLYTKRYGPPSQGLWSSTDQGNSFIPLAPDSYNGLNFVDSLHGVASPFNSSALWTADGGITWLPSNSNTESWGVYAEKGTPNFVMAGEQYIGTYSKLTSVMRSTTYGMSWNLVGTIPIRSTGHIAGVGKVMYVQSDNLHSYNFQLVQGMYRTTDGGYTWKWVEGPNHYRDSRFCVVGCLGGIVYAFDGVGGVWKTTDGGDGLITEPPKSPSFSPDHASLIVDKCSSLRDTFQLSNLTCEAVTIESIEFFDSTMEIVKSGALAFGRLPQLPVRLDPANSDFLSITWDPQLSGAPNPSGTNFIRVRSSAFDGSMKFDTLLVVQVKGVGNAPVPLLKSDSLKLQSVSLCQTREDIVSIGNPGCDSMLITAASINGSASWAVFDISGNPLALPIIIPPKAVADLKVRFTPSAIGTFNSDLLLRLSKDGFDVDTSVALSCRVYRGQTMTSLGSVDLGSVPICYQPDTTIYLVNQAECEVLRIDSILLDPGQFTMSHDPLPHDLAPGDSFAIHLIYTPQKNAPALSSLSAYYTASTDTFSIETVMYGFGLPGTSGILFTGNYAQYAFYDKTKCSLSDSIEFEISNPGCDTLMLVSATFVTSSPEAIQYRINRQLPSIFANVNDKVRVAVAAYPTVVGDHSATLTLHYQLSDYSQFDTTFFFTSRVTEGPRVVALSRNSVDFGTTALCESRDTAIEIVNTGCAPVTVKSISVQGSPQYVFTKVRQTPYSLDRFERDTIVLSYVPTLPGQFDADVYIEFNTDQDSARVIPVDVTTNNKSFLTMELVERAQGRFAGDTILFDLVPNRDWSDPNLTDLSFDLYYDDDLLTYIAGWPELPEGAVVTEEDVIGGIRRLHIDMANTSGLSLSGGTPLLTVSFETALTDTLTTSMTLAGLALNKDNTYYKNCILATDTRDTAFTLLLRCGESTVQKFMLGRSVFSISQHRPNPLTDATGFTLKIPVRLEVPSSLVANVFDDHGRRVLTKQFSSLQSGAHTLELDCAQLASGSYEYIISLGEGESPSPVSAKFMIVK